MSTFKYRQSLFDKLIQPIIKINYNIIKLSYNRFIYNVDKYIYFE